MKVVNLIALSDQNQNLVHNQYDSIGRRVGLTYPDGTQTKYEYDLNDNLIKVSTGNDVTNYTYDVLGNLLSTTLPNGSVTSYSYDANNQISTLKTISKAGTVLSNIEYAYDERGNISKEDSTIDGVKTVKTYTYDEEEQLLSSTHVSGSTTKEYSYLYDQVGNKLAATETINGKVTNKQYKFDNKNALVEEKGGLGVDYSYDATGNVSQKRYANGVVENFKYDAESMLLSVQSTTGKTINYSYDGFGNRTQKTEKTEVTQSEGSGFLSFLKTDNTYNEDYNQELVSQTTNEQLGNLRQTISDHLDTYDQTCPVDDEDGPKASLETINYVNDINREFTEVLQTENANGNTIHTYTYGVQRINDKKQDNAPTYYAYDGRGSVLGQETTQKPEQLSFKVTYNDFGKTNIKMDNQFGYNAESHDYNSSQYLRARYYDNKSGTFGQQDTYMGDTESPASQNRYAYTMNNGVNNSDPSGHKATKAPPSISRPLSGHVCLSDKGILYNCPNTPSISKPGYQTSSPLSGGGTPESYKAYDDYWNNQASDSNSYYYDWMQDTQDRQERDMLKDAIIADGVKIPESLWGRSMDEQLAYLREVKKYCDMIGTNDKFTKELAQQMADLLLPGARGVPEFGDDWEARFGYMSGGASGIMQSQGMLFVTDLPPWAKDLMGIIGFGGLLVSGGFLVWGAMGFFTTAAGSTTSLFEWLTTQGDKTSSASLTFSSTEKLADHFERHGADFGSQNASQYLDSANNFMNKPVVGTIQEFISNDGWIFRYDTATNTFGLINNYGNISTYYKPIEGYAYWLEQISKYRP